jgi:tripartite-type tricarboxylate transporter receptor subunit TctC
MSNARRLLLLVAVTLLAAGCSLPGRTSGGAGASFPSRPITMIVPYAAGGSTDLLARKVAELMRVQLGQPVEVVNRGGGNATVGVSEAFHNPPDGYTLAYATSAAMVIQPNIGDYGYKSPDDYLPVSKVAQTATVIVVGSSAPWQNMHDFVEYGKSHPGELRVGIATFGGVGHLDLVELSESTGAQFTFVPLAGAGESIPAVLGGHIEATTTSATSVQGHVQAGTIRILGVPAEKRAALFPDVPTFKDQGYNITRAEYHVVVAPKGTPDAVVQTLQDTLQKVVADPTFVKFANDNGITPDYKNAADTRTQLQTDYEYYGPVVKKLGLQG